MRRAPVPLQIVPSHVVTGRYHGWGRGRRIEITTAAISLLTKEEVLAIVGHELGHRELYHVERDFALWLAMVGCVVTASAHGMIGWMAVAALAGTAAILLHRLACEFEADAYAVRHRGAKHLVALFDALEQYHPPIARTFAFRARRAVARWRAR